MCGIAGIIGKNSPTLGQDLVNMLKELEHRGRDATGVAVYEQREDIQIRASLTDPCYERELEEIIAMFGKVRKARSYHGEGIFSFYEGSIEMDLSQIGRLHWDIDSHPQLCVHSLGQHLKVYKDQGSAEDLQRTHEIRVGNLHPRYRACAPGYRDGGKHQLRPPLHLLSLSGAGHCA